jgi:hypothetical protein
VFDVEAEGPRPAAGREGDDRMTAMERKFDEMSASGPSIVQPKIEEGIFLFFSPVTH